MKEVIFIIVALIIFLIWYDLTRTPEQRKQAAEQLKLANARPVKRVVRRKRKSGNDKLAKAIVKTGSVIGGGIIKGLLKAGSSKRR